MSLVTLLSTTWAAARSTLSKQSVWLAFAFVAAAVVFAAVLVAAVVACVCRMAFWMSPNAAITVSSFCAVTVSLTDVVELSAARFRVLRVAFAATASACVEAAAAYASSSEAEAAAADAWSWAISAASVGTSGSSLAVVWAARSSAAFASTNAPFAYACASASASFIAFTVVLTAATLVLANARAAMYAAAVLGPLVPSTSTTGIVSRIPF